MDNNVILLGHYGGDETHCLSAWQSTNLELGIELDNDISKRIEQLYQATVVNKKKSPEELLTMLATSNHHTPFEKSCLHFQIRGDIVSMTSYIIKHRISVSVNSESARYKELADKWYLPSDWKEQEYDFEDLPINAKDRCIQDIFYDCNDWYDVLNEYTNLGHQLYHLACQQLSKPLGRKRAKETARYFLPYNKQLDFDCMFNFRSFIHFQTLRNNPDPQKEIQDIAQQMLDLVKAIPNNPFEYSLKAFGCYEFL